jgi:hypothetical protein
MSINTTRNLSQNGPTTFDVVDHFVKTHKIESLFYVCCKQLIISNYNITLYGTFSTQILSQKTT